MARPMHKLTVRRVEALAQSGMYGDGGGLWLRMRDDGSKGWVFIWIRDKKRHEMHLGPYSTYTLAEAREMAAAARQLLKEGLDPMAARKAAQERARAERALQDAQEAALLPSTAPTFLKVAEQYIAEHEAGWRNAKHRWQWNNSLTKHAKGLLDKPVDTITSDDVLAVLKEIWGTIPDTAGRVRTRVETILDAAKAQGFIKSPWENPARWKGNLIHRLPRRARMSKGHYAAMAYDDMPDFFAALNLRPAPAARALELTILCATRTNETLGMRWREVDLENGIWIVPGDRMKMGVEHRIPLSDPAIAILKKIAGDEPVCPEGFVFPGQYKGTPLSQMSMTMVMRRMKLGHFTVHGMRSAFRDYMGDMSDHAEAVVEQALAHQVGDSTVRAYRRKDAFEKRRLVMRDWAIYLLKAPAEAIDHLPQQIAA